MAAKKQVKPKAKAKSKAKPKKITPQKKKPAEKMPFCTSAASAEHYRAHNEDAPCDDGRKGK
jgi:hypothetical protein